MHCFQLGTPNSKGVHNTGRNGALRISIYRWMHTWAMLVPSFKESYNYSLLFPGLPLLLPSPFQATPEPD